MTHWIAFWTALWVGSSRITRRTVDWLCNAKPKPADAPAKPVKEPADGTGETHKDPETSPGEEAKTPKKPTETAAAAEGSAGLRWVGLLITAAVVKGLPWTTMITLGLITAWVLTSLALGYIAALPAEEPAAEQPAEPESEAADDTRHPSEILTREHVALLLAEVYTEGSGVHLATLAEHLTRTPLVGLPATPWKTGHVRALLTRHEVRVRDGVRVPPKGGREGVHREDFPPLPPRLPGPHVVGDVAAGQSNNNNAGNTYPFTVTEDPDNPVRHTVHHSERT